MKFYTCDTCGKVICAIKSTSAATVCCGQEMRELIPGTTDGVTEKHVPVYQVSGQTVTVRVGMHEHPMTDSHRIEWIALETDSGCQRKDLKTTDRPEATFALVPYDKVRSVYEYCNLHGLWAAHAERRG